MVANKGILPIGLITTKRAMVDLRISSPKIFKYEDKSINIIKNESIVIILFYVIITVFKV
jgi:hypothetical protein